MSKTTRYVIACGECAHRMRVKKKHFGHMCRCTQCHHPIYVTYDAVTPPIKPFEIDGPRHFALEDVPIYWKPGDLFMDQYLVEEKIGEGGMGEVHRVQHRGWGQDVAVKSLSPKLVKHEDQIENFHRECEFWVNLGLHPNTICCYYVRRMGGIPRVFIEYMPKGSLLDAMKKGSLYKGEDDEVLKRILDVAIQFAWGLEHGHSQGMLHLDVKPSNLLLTNDGGAKVTDFGLSRAFLSDGSGVDPADLYMGTPPYVAPEREKADQVTLKSDIWSWALCVVEMFEGRITWRNGKLARQVLGTHLQRGSVRKDVSIPPMPGALADVLNRCFEENPEGRPESMAELVDALRKVYADSLGEPYERVSPKQMGHTAHLLNNGAVSLLDLGKTHKATTLWQEALSLDKQHFETLFNVGLNDWRTGRRSPMRFLKDLYQLCEERDGEWLPVFYLARVLIECGQFSKAYEVLKTIQQGDSVQKDVVIALDEARRHRKSSRRMVNEFRAHEAVVTSVNLTWDGWKALSTSNDGTAKLWEIATGDCSMTLTGHEGKVYTGCIRRDEKCVVTGGEDCTVKVWEAKTGRCIKTLEGHEQGVLSVAVDWDGKRAVSAGLDRTVRLWDLEKGKCLSTMYGHSDSIDTVTISRSGAMAISGGRDNLVKVWNLESGKCVRNFEGHTQRITQVCLTENRSRVLSSCRDGKIMVWDTETGLCLKTIDAHKSDAYSLSITPDGLLALSASRGWTMKLWDVERGQCLYTFPARAPVALSRDGRYALSGGMGGSLRLWYMHCDVKSIPAPYALCRSVEDAV